jgi:hypothetical protein
MRHARPAISPRPSLLVTRRESLRPLHRIALLVGLSCALALAPVTVGPSRGPLGSQITGVALAATAPLAEAPSTATATSGGRCDTPKRSAPPGWRRIMSDSFNTYIRRGAWGRPGGRHEFPSGKWRARQAGAKDTSGRGTYNSMKTTSQHDGLLDVWIHSEDGNRYVAAPIPLVGDRKAQRVSLCMRADHISGYKIALMLWPKEGPGNYHGEIDFPEGKLSRHRNANAFMHYDPKPSSGKTQDWFDSGVRLQGWHVFTMRWRPSMDIVTFMVDGRLIGRSRGRKVPNGPMHYIMQMETWVSGKLPPPAAGHVKVDWFTIDVPN